MAAIIYNGNTGILGPGQATPEQIDLWFAANGPAAAKSFAPDKTYRPAPTGLGKLIKRACTYPEFGIVVNWDLIAGDIAKECAFWQSAIVRTKNNPSGLGATNDNPGGNAVSFSTPFDGILATVAHMLNYFVGEGPWSKYDPRTAVLRQVGYMGICKKLSDLDGRWAYPGVGYGASVALYGNRLLETPANGGNVTAQIPGFAWHPADDRHHTKGRTKKIAGFAVHYTGRPTPDGNSLNWLTVHPESDVSATFLIKHRPTLQDRGWQLVRIEDTPHTTGGIVNPFTVSFEYELMLGQSVTSEAYDVMAQTILDAARYVKQNGLGEIPLTRGAIKGHKEWVGDNRICPDGIEVDRIVQRIHELDGAVSMPDEEKFDTGYTLIGAFLNLYRAARDADVHWKTIGVPIGPEIRDVPVAYMQPDGSSKVIPSVVQQTDRGGGWLLWNPETDVATMATQFEREQIEKHLGLRRETPVGEYINTLTELIARMRLALDDDDA